MNADFSQIIVLGSVVGLLTLGTSHWRDKASPSPVAVAEGPRVRDPWPYQIDLNAADEKAFTLIPGIGPALAHRLVLARQRHGPFCSLAALDAVAGIGPKTLQALLPFLQHPWSCLTAPKEP